MRDRVPAFDMRAVVVLLIFAYFGVAYAHSPTDETLKGALIAAFSGAWGFYLGSSRSNVEVREEARAATSAARDAVQLARETISETDDKPQEVEVVNTPASPIPTTDAAPSSDDDSIPAYARP